MDRNTHETRVGDILLVARSQAGGKQVLEWTPVALPVSALPQAPAVRVPSAPSAPPASFTRAGLPLRAKQMAVRARWDHAVTTHMQRQEARRAAESSGTRYDIDGDEPSPQPGTFLLNENRGHFS